MPVESVIGRSNCRSRSTFFSCLVGGQITTAWRKLSKTITNGFIDVGAAAGEFAYHPEEVRVTGSIPVVVAKRKKISARPET